MEDVTAASTRTLIPIRTWSLFFAHGNLVSPLRPALNADRVRLGELEQVRTLVVPQPSASLVTCAWSLLIVDRYDVRAQLDVGKDWRW